VPQDVFLFSDTVENNIRFAVKNATEVMVKDAAANAVINNEIEYFPQKYKTIIGERGVTLSLPQSIATNSTPTFGGLEILSSTNASTPAPVMTSLQKIKIANPTAGKTVYCIDCLANDGSTGVTQTYNGKQWKNYW
jgi:hypothetical protein